MAASLKSTESYVAACLSDAKTLNLYNDGDANIIKEVILDYFTSRNDIDSDESDEFCDDDNEERVSDTSDSAVLTAYEYENRGPNSPQGGKAPGTKLTSTKLPATTGIIRPRKEKLHARTIFVK